MTPAIIRTAAGLIAWYMRACGFAGWAPFWRVIYVLPGHENNERLLRHHEGGYSDHGATCRLKLSLLLSNTPESL